MSFFNFFSGSNEEEPNTQGVPDLNEEYYVYGSHPTWDEENYNAVNDQTHITGLPDLNQEPTYDIHGTMSALYDLSVGEAPYYGTQSSAHQFPVADTPYYGGPSSSHQLPVADTPYYGTQSSAYPLPLENTPYYGTQGSSYQLPGDFQRNVEEDERLGDLGEEEIDEDYIREATVSYKTNNLFNDRSELESWVKNRGREHGCVVVVQRSRENGVELGCNRGGEPRLRGTVRRTGSIKKGCPFKLLGKYDARSQGWRVEIVNETNNHDAVGFEEGHAYLRKMTADELDMVEKLHRSGVRPGKICSAIRKEFPGSRCVFKDIYNAVSRIKDQMKIGDSSMKVLEHFLSNNGFSFYTRENPSTNSPEEIFFCHTESFKMWRAFPEMLLIDTTYNTNTYKWPIMQFVGVTSTSKSFCIACAFIIREQERNFTWVLERLKEILGDGVKPRLILTDRDLALMKSCDTVFPDSTKNLCRWHISENIRKKFRSLYQTEPDDDFSYWWKVLYKSPSPKDFEFNCGKFEDMLAKRGRRDAWKYIRDNWLVPYKHLFVACWVDERRNYGEHTTNRVESQHSNLKRYIEGTNNTLDTIAGCVLEIVTSQIREIGKTFEDSRIKVLETHRIPLFQNLLYRVSIKCLELLEKEMVLLEKMRDNGVSCGHYLFTSSGLPCACRLEGYLINQRPIPLSAIDPFWKRLDFRPAFVENQEPDYEAGMEELKQTFLAIEDPNQKRSLFSKLKSVFPGKSKKTEPLKREDPRGRPMKKLEPPRTSSYTPSVSRDPARHSSYTASPSRDPARHSSYTPRPRQSLYENQHTTADLGFPLMVDPVKVPIIERYKDVIPYWSHKFISDIVDVRPDGNCGFRAIAVGLGKKQKDWAEVRRNIIKELDSHHDWWKHTLDQEQEGVFDHVRGSADWFDSVRPAPVSHWFGVPGHALVVAQTYGCVLVHLRDTSSETYFPLIHGPNKHDDIPVIAVVFVGDNHWIYVKLEGSFPMPVPTRYWQRYATQKAAKEWTEFYEHRISEYRMLMATWRQPFDPANYIDVG